MMIVRFFLLLRLYLGKLYTLVAFVNAKIYGKIIANHCRNY